MNAKRHDPTEYIKQHNDRVKNLVFNQRIVDTDLTYIFAYLNRLYFSDLIVGVTIRWTSHKIRSAGTVCIMYNKF